jgi:hypothetical protein
MMGRNFFNDNMDKVWGGMKRGWEPGGLFARTAEVAWGLRFEVAAAIASELLWWIVRAIVQWIFKTVPRRRGARVIKFRPILRPV